MKRYLRALLAAACWFSLASSALAASALPSLPQPSASFDFGALRVDRYGNGIKVVVFLPGLVEIFAQQQAVNDAITRFLAEAP